MAVLLRFLFFICITFALPIMAETAELDPAIAPNEDHFMRDFMNMLASLGLIIIVIFIASWLMKRLMSTRMQQMNETSEIKILERRTLTPKTAIYLIEIGGKGLAVAESTNGITLLTQLPTDFSKILENKINKEGSASDQ